MGLHHRESFDEFSVGIGGIQNEIMMNILKKAFTYSTTCTVAHARLVSCREVAGEGSLNK
jgi:hypothetical protein